MGRRKYGVICLIASGVLFGTAPLSCYIAAILGSNNNTFLAMRCLLAIPVICLVLKKAHIPLRMPVLGARDGMIGATINGVCALLLTLSYGYIGGGMGTTLHFVYPMCVMMFCCLIYKAKVNLLKIMALVLGTGGVALFGGAGGDISLTGIVLAVLSGVVYSIYIVYIEHSHINKLHPLQMAIFSNLGMGMVALIYGIVSKQFSLVHYTPWTVLFCIVPILTASLGAQPLFQIGVRNTDATTSSLLSTTEPITAVILGILFMHEEMTLAKLMGCVCILCGVLLVILGEHHEGETEEIS